MSLDRETLAGDMVTRLRERGIKLPSPVLLLPFIGIVASESLLYFGSPYYALGGHIVTLLVCVFAPLRFDDATPVLQAFALVPVFRLVNLGMPVFFRLTIYWFPLMYGPLIPTVYLVGRAREPSLDLGWKPALVALPVAIPISAVLAVIEFQILQPEALIPAWTPSQVVLISVVMIGFVGFVEELLFRGVLQRILQQQIGRWMGLLLASGVFGLMHSGYSVPAELVFGASIGFVLGLVYDWTDSIALITILHGVLNVFLFAVIPMHESLVGLSLPVG